jgi:hypothetical protein
MQPKDVSVSTNFHHHDGGGTCSNSQVAVGPSLQRTSSPHNSSHAATAAAASKISPLASGDTVASIGKTTTTHHHPQQTGRKGDPRMHRAVQARLANPTMSLLEALQRGGFDYDVKANDANSVDSENVTLGQRKNQLSRRLRLATKQNLPATVANHKVVSLIPVKSSSTVIANNQSVVVESHIAKLLADVVQVSSSGSKRRRTEQETPQVPCASHTVDAAAAAAVGVLSGNTSDGTASNPTAASSDNAIGAKGHGTVAAAAAETAHVHCDVSASNLLSNNTKEDVAVFEHSLDSPPRGAAASSAHHGTSVLVSAESTEKPHRRRRKTCHDAPNSAVSAAIVSFQQTAACKGLTLDELALALRNQSDNLAETLAPRNSSAAASAALPSCTTTTAQQQDLAVALLHTEQRASCTKSMLLAGYALDVAQDEHSPCYMQVALAAWQLEGQRLKALANTCHAQSSSGHEVNKSSINAPTASTCNGISALRDTVDDTLEAAQDGRSSAGCPADQHRHGHDDSEDHPHAHHGAHHAHVAPHLERPGPSLSTTAAAAAAAATDLECVNETNRHIHRLGGKCGHIPILHQPAGGLPHIDFVVGDQVECYQGIQALSQDLLWPSSFCCEDLSCPDSCKEDAIPPKNCTKDHEHKHAECIIGGDPKVFDLNELNLDGAEWNLDFANGDSLMGLFKLAEQ